MDSTLTKKKGLLERLQDGVVIGDGSYVVNLEKRGYVTAGMWTPEAVIKYPEAVLQLHRDYLQAGADILTTFTFYSNGGALQTKQFRRTLTTTTTFIPSADVVGVNCMYDPTITLKTLALMKRGLEEAGIEAYLMAQPLGYHTQEIENDPRGYIALPEFPFAMEPRLLTRMDVHTFTRKAYELGVRYIGGCCGYEPYHIRASAEELAAERGRRPPGADNHEGFKSLERSSFKEQWERAKPEYWANLVPAAGRKIKLLATD